MKNQEVEWLLKEKYHGKKTSEFSRDCKRLAAGEPLGHVIGWVPFLDCQIYLSSDIDHVPPSPASAKASDRRSLPPVATRIKAKKFTLIPRPETEFWVERAIASIKNRYHRGQTPVIKILDLCAGSGCIGVAVAKAIPDAHVTFAEIDADHLPTIARNINQNLPNNPLSADVTPSSRSFLELGTTNETAAKPRYQVSLADLFSPIITSSSPDLELRVFDYILCNPPYIDPTLDRTETSVKDFEPHIALYGGEAGLELIAKIIADSPLHLSPGGQLWLEHEPEQSAAIKKLGAAAGFSATTHTDQYNIERYSVLVLK